MKIGIIREEKVPPDSRVPLTPDQCVEMESKYADQIQIFVQPSPNRCYKDSEYLSRQVKMKEDLSDCDVLMGVKEVPTDKLISDKTYFFFSHTIKEQAYNRKLLQTILQKRIRMIDYEVLTNERKQRLIAFGKFAGMVGAHNGIMTYGVRSGAYQLKRMKHVKDYQEAKEIYQNLHLPKLKIVLTGKGRVASGAVLVLKDMGIRQVEPNEFLEQDFSEAIFTQLDCKDYVARKDGQTFDLQDFFKNPQLHKNIFTPYIYASDVMINGIYWDNEAPAFFTKEEMKQPNFRIKVIADVTCDIAPQSSIPSTLRASTIADPVFGYDPNTEAEAAPYQEQVIDMMTIDNLPNELPRDASHAFGNQFMEHIMDELLLEKSEVIERATIANQGRLGKYFDYLSNYVKMS